MMLGLILVICIIGSYCLRSHGISNPVITMFTKNAAVSSSWMDILSGRENKYARHQNALEKMNSVSVSIRDTVESFCTSAIPGNRFCKSFSDSYRQVVMHSTISSVPGGKTNQEYAEEAFLDVKEFSEYVKAQGIDFLYVQLPFGTRIKAFSSHASYPSEELDMWDRFSNLMYHSDMNFLNLNDDTAFLETVSLDVTEHWMPKDALQATKTVAETVNRLFGYEIDTSLFDLSLYRNALLDSPKTMDSIQDEFGYCYEMWIPIKSPDYRVIQNEKAVYEGDFLSALLTPMSNWDRRADDGSAISYHDMWRLRNGTFLDIRNKTTSHNTGKKILLLGDSFSWPISAYLSQDVGEIVAMHPRYFNGDVRTYMEYYQPDLVLWIYVEAQVGSFNQQNFSVLN